MPSIADAVKAAGSLKGYSVVEPASLPVVPQMINDNKPKANPNIRCPLPPFNSNPDTLRQFETGTTMPQIRVIPLPTIKQAAPSRAAVASSSSAGSSSSTTIPGTIKPVSVALNTGGILAGSSFMGSVSLVAESFQLLSMTSDSQCEVRLYGTADVQSGDVGRLEGDPLPAETTQNVVSCVSMDTLPFSWEWQNRTGANQDTPQARTLYITVFNTTDFDVTNILVTLAYVPLEA